MSNAKQKKMIVVLNCIGQSHARVFFCLTDTIFLLSMSRPAQYTKYYRMTQNCFLCWNNMYIS
eukprot:SAG22_NODE_379_length_11417_cov_211.325647_8_plen_63_part_00